MFSKLERFTALRLCDKILLLHTLLVLAFAKMVILFIPLKKIAPRLGELNGTTAVSLTQQQLQQAERVKHFILMVSGNVPWNSVCLDQALAAMLLLRRYKIPCRLCLGVKKNEAQKKLDAHAWIECDDTILVGGIRSRLYTKVAHFANSCTA